MKRTGFPLWPTPGIAARALPASRDFLLANANLPLRLLDQHIAAPTIDGMVRADILVREGRVAALGPEIVTDLPTADAQGSLIWPTCCELHTHLDKGHIAFRAKNTSGDIRGAVEATARDRTDRWNAPDIAQRFEFSLRCALAHGTSAMRTHIDSYASQSLISWPEFKRLQREWAGRIDLQGVCLSLLDVYETDEGRQLADLATQCGGLLGGVTRFESLDPQPMQRLASALDRLLELAKERDVDVDLHVDETSALEPNTLREVAVAVLRNKFKGKVTCGHCCSLALRDPIDQRDTIALIRDAGLAIVALPMVNLHLQSRGSGTPRWRGVTAIHELRAAGVPVAVSSDNCRDPFFSFGDFDPIELFRESARICHFDSDLPLWSQSITRWPADIMKIADHGRIKVGANADLIVFRARSFNELLSRPQSDRVVLRAGRAISTILPDYRELDVLASSELLGSTHAT